MGITYGDYCGYCKRPVHHVRVGRADGMVIVGGCCIALLSLLGWMILAATAGWAVARGLK